MRPTKIFRYIDLFLPFPFFNFKKNKKVFFFFSFRKKKYSVFSLSKIFQNIHIT